MQKTVRELMEMIRTGALHYNQSTQRKFVYADMDAQLPQGPTTKSGKLINSMLEHNIQLPALYFWKNSETGHLNIHDGKQRLLSIYYFMYPTAQINISTHIGQLTNVTWEGLTEELQNKLLDYTFDIVEHEGTSAEEEDSFDLINSNAVPLTAYECLSGMFYGKFLKGFEDYLDSQSKVLDFVKPVGRGEQAYKLLMICLDVTSDKQTAGNSRANLNLKHRLRPIRQNEFKASDYLFDKILDLFNELMRAIKGIKEERALRLAADLIREGFDTKKLVTYYRDCMKVRNDIAKWDIATHTTFYRAYLLQNIKLDPQREFGKDVKDALYAESPKCAYPGCKETSYSKLEVDHIVPWSLGGLTVLDNAQLLCKHHNTSKGNKI